MRTELRNVVIVALAMALTTPATTAGKVFLTGHDPDFHAQSSIGAQNLLNAGLSFVTDGTHNLNDGNKFLWVESRISPPGGHLIGENGLIAVGLTLGIHYDRADASEIPAAVFEDYTAIVIASSFGGLLTRDELDALIARSDDIKDYINGGGGLMALSECFPCGASLLGGGTDPDLYGFLPVEVSSIPASPPFTITPFGAAAPFFLTNGDINDPTHNSFGLIGGLEPIDLDTSSQATTLAGEVFVGGGGLSQISLLPEKATNFVGTVHDLTANVFDALGDPIEDVEVTFNVISGPNAGDTGMDTTDANGDAFFSYVGDGGVGTDIIEASFVDSRGEIQTSNQAIKIWEEPVECFLVAGPGPGASTFFDELHVFQTQVGPVVEDSFAVLMDDIPEFVLPTVPTAGRVPPSAVGMPGFGGTAASTGGLSGSSTPPWMLDGQFAVQVLMWNPGVFPQLPEQYSAGLYVVILPGGDVVATSYGTSEGGLQISYEIGTNGHGQKVIRFPFVVPGL